MRRRARTPSDCQCRRGGEPLVTRRQAQRSLQTYSTSRGGIRPVEAGRAHVLSGEDAGVRACARLFGQERALQQRPAATPGSREVTTTAGLDGHRHDDGRYERHGQPPDSRSHSLHGQPGGPGMRNEPVAAAPAAAASLVTRTRRTSDQILQGRCISARRGLRMGLEVRGACNEPL